MARVCAALIAKNETGRHEIITHSLIGVGFTGLSTVAYGCLAPDTINVLDAAINNIKNATMPEEGTLAFLHSVYQLSESKDPLLRTCLLNSTAHPTVELIACLSAFGSDTELSEDTIMNAVSFAFPHIKSCSGDFAKVINSRFGEPTLDTAEKLVSGEGMTPKESLSVAAMILALVSERTNTKRSRSPEHTVPGASGVTTAPEAPRPRAKRPKIVLTPAETVCQMTSARVPAPTSPASALTPKAPATPATTNLVLGMTQEERKFLLTHAEDEGIAYQRRSQNLHDWDAMADLMEKHFDRAFDRDHIRRYYYGAKKAHEFIVL